MFGYLPIYQDMFIFFLSSLVFFIFKRNVQYNWDVKIKDECRTENQRTKSNRENVADNITMNKVTVRNFITVGQNFTAQKVTVSKKIKIMLILLNI